MIPDNGGYATAAYVVAAVIYVAYALSVRIRTNAIRARARSITDMHGDTQ